MSEEIQKFDISDVIRNKVRTMFSDIIPDEVLDGYLNREVRGFFSNEVERNWSGGKETPIPNSSPFSKLVRQEVLDYLKSNLSKQIAEKVKALVDEVGTDGLVNMIAQAKAKYDADIQAQVFIQVFSNLPYNIQNVVSQMRSNGQL